MLKQIKFIGLEQISFFIIKQAQFKYIAKV